MSWTQWRGRAPCTASRHEIPGGLKDCVLSGGALLGLAFNPLGGLVVSSSETGAYRLDVGLRGVLPVQPAASPIQA